MPILSQFLVTLTTLHWSELLNRQFKVGDICQILHLDSMVHLFCMRKRDNWFNYYKLSQGYSSVLLEEKEQFASLLQLE